MRFCQVTMRLRITSLKSGTNRKRSGDKGPCPVTTMQASSAIWARVFIPYPVSFRETFFTGVYRFSTVVSHSVVPGCDVSILSYGLFYLLALGGVWGGIGPTSNPSVAKEHQLQIGTSAYSCSRSSVASSNSWRELETLNAARI